MMYGWMNVWVYECSLWVDELVNKCLVDEWVNKYGWMNG